MESDQQALDSLNLNAPTRRSNNLLFKFSVISFACISDESSNVNDIADNVLPIKTRLFMEYRVHNF